MSDKRTADDSMCSKIIANYLPQFHRIPENDKWWGEGFTDWEAVKKAKPLYKGHIQPKEPLDGNYYSLDNADTIRKQAKLAKKYGVYGFGIYHYWFNSKMQLLQKPAELILANKDIDINFMFIWDNSSWKRTWSNVKNANDWAPNFDGNAELEQKEREVNASGILAELVYGDEKDWKTHFDYLLPFFKDERYIKVDNKPVFGIFQPNNDFETVKKMVEYWDKLAKEAGFDGIRCMGRDWTIGKNLEYKMRYTPLVSVGIFDRILQGIKRRLARYTNRIFFYDYDWHWREILYYAKKADDKTYLSGFVTYDDTPRRGIKARIVKGATPQKFEKYLKRLLKISTDQKKELIFVSAWNEWGEGMCLEPDKQYGYQWLEALKNASENIRGGGNPV